MSESLSTCDLRRSATEAKRHNDQKAKWAYGGRPAQAEAMRILPPDLLITRPAVPMRGNRAIKNGNQHNINQLARGEKTALRHEVREILDNGPSDSSGDESIDEPSAVEMDPTNSQEDDESLVSYDVSGQTLFADVVNKAIEKYETKVTDKLVKEYEMVSHESEASTGYLADDDFELVDRVHL